MLQCYGEYGVTPYSLLLWGRPTELKLVLLVATELFRILVSPHFQKTKSLNNQVMMKWTWKGWVYVFLYQSHVFFILFIFLIFSILNYFIYFSSLRKLVYQDCKQYVVAGLNTLMSISDGLGPSIFCRKMEKARLMMEEVDGKFVYFPPESAFLTLM